MTILCSVDINKYAFDQIETIYWIHAYSKYDICNDESF